MERREKEHAVVDLKGRFTRASAAVVTEYRGLTVADLNALRRDLREVAGEYRVAKNSLVELAIEGSPYLSLKDLLIGQNGLVFGYGDAAGLAKVLTRYARDHDKLIIKGGVSEGQFLPTARVEMLAQLPNREGMRAQLLGLLSRPAAQLLGVLTAPAAQLARALNARKTQLETT
jgi:large subunit ribosomal protein L10